MNKGGYMKSYKELEAQLIEEYSEVLKYASDSRWKEFVDACYEEYCEANAE
jgi:preprotein translocase subunit Sss1